MIDTGNVTTATLSGLSQGTAYYFAVAAYAANGLEGALSSQISYTPSLAPSLAPTIALTSPANNSTYSAPATISLAATVVANGHTITQVQFFNGTTLLGQSTVAPYSLTWSNLSTGTYSVSAALVYDSGSTVSSIPVSVSVVAPPASPTGVSFAAGSGSINTPFVVNNGILYQNIETTTVTNGGRAVYSFTVSTTGDYVIRALACCTNTGANSFYVNIDAEPVDPTMIWDIPVSSGFTSTLVSWRGNGIGENDQFQPKVFNLIAGTHQLIVRGREAYAQVQSFAIVPANTLPAPWQAIDIGTPGLTGAASVSNSQFTVSGAGNISGAADNFRFVYQNMTGDGEIRALIGPVQSAGSTAVVGVMIRESLTPGSKYTMMGYTSGGAFCSQRRLNSSSSTSYVTANAPSPKQVWVRLVRSGTTYSAFQSTDGVNWKQTANWSELIASSSYIGFAVSSGDSASLATTSFSNWMVIP